MHKVAQILIVDDDPSLCFILEEMVRSIGMAAESVTELSSAIRMIEEKYYDIIFLDVYMVGGSGLDLIPTIKHNCSDTIIMVISGYADKDIAVKALRLGAFDLLEKPIERELLSHAISRALRALRLDRKVQRLVKALKEKKSELMTQLKRLESLNSRLIETNNALSLLAQNIDLERDAMEKRIALKLKSLVIPALDKFRRDVAFHHKKFEINMLIKQIDDLTTGFSTDARLAVTLSYTELCIASLIKNGLNTEQIAEHLHVASSTVKTHRKNIRKKLKINNSQYSLRNYLSSKNTHSLS